MAARSRDLHADRFVVMVYGPTFIVNTGIVFSQSWIGVESLSSLQPDKHGGMKTDEDLLNPSLGSAHLQSGSWTLLSGLLQVSHVC